MQRQHEHDPGRSSSTGQGLAPGGGQPSEGFHARGAAINPASRFETISLAQLPPGGGDDDLIHEEIDEQGAQRVATRYLRDHARSIINPVDSPDLNFKWTINPYRGCEHGCIYCYARPTHEYLGFSSGLDFETRILCKMDAAQLLRAELARPGWNAEPIMLSGITDAYQPVERRLRLTRDCLQVMHDHHQPVSIVTKSALVLRDLDLLSAMAERNTAKVAISITTLDPALSASMEPRAASPALRLRAVRELSAAGVPVVVMAAPIIPSVNDAELPRILEAAAHAGAIGAGYVLLRLPWQNKTLFLEWLARRFPDRAGKITSLLKDARGGRLYDAQWNQRMRGSGPFADQIAQTFAIFARRLGLDARRAPLSSASFKRPEPAPSPSRRADPAQMTLFG